MHRKNPAIRVQWLLGMLIVAVAMIALMWLLLASAEGPAGL